MKQEIWKDIKDYEGLYQISNFGNVKRIIFKNGKYEFKKERILKCQHDKDGYSVHGLTKNGKTKKFLTHRLLAVAFIPNPENKPEVNHIDGNKSNNNLKNLEWVTSSENRIHAYKNNLNKKYYGKEHWNFNKIGKLHPQSKPIIQYDEQNNLIKEWGSIGEASKKTNINISNIHSVCNNKRKTAGGYIWKYREEK